MSEERPAITEADILDQVLFPDDQISPESARSLLSLQFSSTAISRMNELAEKNRAGAITAAEQGELEKYLRVGNVVNVIKAKARLSIHRQGHAI